MFTLIVMKKYNLTINPTTNELNCQKTYHVFREQNRDVKKRERCKNHIQLEKRYHPQV